MLRRSFLPIGMILLAGPVFAVEPGEILPRDIEYDEPDARIRYRMRDVAGSWGNSEVVAQSTASESTYHLPRLRVDVNNHIHIV